MIDRDAPLKKEIANNLKHLLKSKGTSQIELSRSTGIARSTISDYFRGNTLIKPGNLEKISEFFNVKKSEIDPSFGSVQEVNFSNFVNIPVIGSVPAGKPQLALEDIEEYMPVLKSYINKDKDYFFLEVEGDSMDLEFDPGSRLLIERTNHLENGQIGVVMVNGDEATVKKVSINNNSITLIPLSSNTSHVPITYDIEDRVYIIGKVIQAIRFIN